MRVNKKGGGVDVFDLQPDQWEFVPSGYDIAATPLNVKDGMHEFSFVPLSVFLLQEQIASLGVGPGDNAFMSGRFIDHDGADTNRPALRFGHISMMPEYMKQFNGSRQLTYCIDIHSRTGFSGSPIFAFRTPGEDLSLPGNIDTTESGKNFVGLLGIHYGQFPEYWRVVNGATVPEGEARNLVMDGQVVKGLSGMTCVAPAWGIVQTIEHPNIKQHIRKLEQLAAMEQALGRVPLVPTAS